MHTANIHLVCPALSLGRLFSLPALDLLAPFKLLNVFSVEHIVWLLAFLESVETALSAQFMTQYIKGIEGLFLVW